MKTGVYVKWEDGKVERYPLHLARLGDQIIGYIKSSKWIEGSQKARKYMLVGFDPSEYAEDDAQIYQVGRVIWEEDAE